MDASQMITVKEVHCLVTLARVYGLPAMQLDERNSQELQAIIDKWDRLDGGKFDPPALEHREGKSDG